MDDDHISARNCQSLETCEACFDDDAFLDWLDDQGVYVAAERVQDEWPEFYRHYTLIGVTSKMGDGGEVLTPTVDYRDAIRYGYVRD